jgi:hypothetical protein
MELKSKCPTGPIETRWEKYKFDLKLVNPANKRKFNVIMVGTGLAGGSAAASMAELGYKADILDWVETWTFNAPKCMAVFRSAGATQAAAH